MFLTQVYFYWNQQAILAIQPFRLRDEGDHVFKVETVNQESAWNQYRVVPDA
jgi:hypothetical protein